MNDVERVNEYVNARLRTLRRRRTPPCRRVARRRRDRLRGRRDEVRVGAPPRLLVARFFSIAIADARRRRGRTGAGKSSLAVALFRIVELSGGRITIDGVDHTRVPLAALRRASRSSSRSPPSSGGRCGTTSRPPPRVRVRAAGTRATRGCGTRCGARASTSVRALAGGLDADVSEGGSNFSAGERQLVCMARALLRRSSVLVMDEATASVDHETDGRIQQMIKDDFNGTATVLTVAHRLHTVVFYEKAMLLAEGGVLEYDAPAALLAKKDGAFRKLAEETGDLMGLAAAAQQ